MHRRKFVIGDIHGNFKGLMYALERAGYKPEQDHLTFLGDVMDSWSQSPEVMDFIISLPKEDVTYVLGNHDECFLEWVQTGIHGAHMLRAHGGLITELRYRQLGAEKIQEHYDWLAAQPFYHIDADNRLFVHAGWNPSLPFKDTRQIGMLDTNEYTWNRSMWYAMMNESLNLDLGKDFKDVFIGHTPTFRFDGAPTVPINRRNIWNLDTGGGFKKGKITVMDIETKSFWQSDLSGSYYPNEAGRG